MKKVIFMCLCLTLTVSMVGCSSAESGNNVSSETAESVMGSTPESSYQDEDTSSAAEEDSAASASKKVQYTVESDYDEGTIGYEADEREAKRKAIEEQAPEEYPDFSFILASLNSLRQPNTYVLDDDDATVDEKKAKLAEIKAAIIEAQSIKDRLDQIEVTINNTDEYEKLSARVSSILSMEAYLSEFEDLVSATPESEEQSEPT